MFPNVFCVMGRNTAPRHVFNMSTGGMLIEKFENDEQSIGDELQVRMNIGDGEHTLPIQVVRAQEKSFGVVFDELNDDEMDFIERVIEASTKAPAQA